MNTEYIQVIEVSGMAVRSQGIFASSAEEIGSDLRLPESLHICFVAVDAPTRLVEPDDMDCFVRWSVRVFAGEIAVEAFRAQDKNDVDWIKISALQLRL